MQINPKCIRIKRNLKLFLGNSPFLIDFWLDKGLSKEQAEYELSCLKPNQINFWMSKGFSLRESERLVSNHQSKCSTKIS